MNIVCWYSLTTGWKDYVTAYDPKTEKLRDPRPGEGILSISDGLFAQWLAAWKGGGDRDPIQEYLNTVTGITGAPAEYAVVQAGMVVNIMYVFDPVICAADMARTVAEHPGAISIASSGVIPGATYLNGVFTNPVQIMVNKGAGQVGA